MTNDDRTIHAHVSNTTTGASQDMVVNLADGAVVSEAPLSDAVSELFAAFGAKAQELADED